MYIFYFCGKYSLIKIHYKSVRYCCILCRCNNDAIIEIIIMIIISLVNKAYSVIIIIENLIYNWTILWLL